MTDWRRCIPHRCTARCADRGGRRGGAGRRPAGTGVDGRDHGGDDVRGARWHVADAHRCTDGGPVVPRRPRCRPPTAAVAVRARPGRTGFRRADPRGGGVGGREHVRRACGSAAVGRGRRRARAAGLSRCQHSRRDDRPPLAAVSAIRLGRSAVRRCAELRRCPRHGCAGGDLRAGRRRFTRGRIARLAARRRPAPQPQRRASSKRHSRARWASGSAGPRSTPTSWRSGRPSATGRRRRSPISFGRCGCRGPCSWSAPSLATAAVSVACRSGRRASLRW